MQSKKLGNFFRPSTFDRRPSATPEVQFRCNSTASQPQHKCKQLHPFAAICASLHLFAVNAVFFRRGDIIHHQWPIARRTAAHLRLLSDLIRLVQTSSELKKSDSCSSFVVVPSARRSYGAKAARPRSNSPSCCPREAPVELAGPVINNHLPAINSPAVFKPVSR